MIQNLRSRVQADISAARNIWLTINSCGAQQGLFSLLLGSPIQSLPNGLA
jgi:hypothetical protein